MPCHNVGPVAAPDPLEPRADRTSAAAARPCWRRDRVHRASIRRGRHGERHLHPVPLEKRYHRSLDYSKIITIEAGKRGGKPCIRGLRITVYGVF